MVAGLVANYYDSLTDKHTGLYLACSDSTLNGIPLALVTRTVQHKTWIQSTPTSIPLQFRRQKSELPVVYSSTGKTARTLALN